jgi:hypothetical protein
LFDGFLDEVRIADRVIELGAELLNAPDTLGVIAHASFSITARTLRTKWQLTLQGSAQATQARPSVERRELNPICDELTAGARLERSLVCTQTAWPPAAGPSLAARKIRSG